MTKIRIKVGVPEPFAAIRSKNHGSTVWIVKIHVRSAPVSDQVIKEKGVPGIEQRDSTQGPGTFNVPVVSKLLHGPFEFLNVFDDPVFLGQETGVQNRKIGLVVVAAQVGGPETKLRRAILWCNGRWNQWSEHVDGIGRQIMTRDAHPADGIIVVSTFIIQVWAIRVPILGTGSRQSMDCPHVIHNHVLSQQARICQKVNEHVGIQQAR
mmetsp:Transcript_19705/g.45873  ORF Transcript_19705/g.45873 Transcript_19705/m.45873 type:complete len:209 (-) Transcript_19705:456-1082(-)